jgi:DNA invertase Pin-like site-specific DNA recombinase
MRAAIYARVSTRDQSTEAQLRDLREYARRRELGIVQEYIDEGISGAKARRPALDEMMAAAKRREFDAVLVWRFDRFARSSRHLVDALDTFHCLGIQFVSYQEQVDTGSPMGQAMFTIIAAMAQLERDLISERVKMGLRNARAKGRKLGRPHGGYTQDDLAKAAELRRQGKTIREIALFTGVPKTTIARHVKLATT